jgi:hypothetical protein
MPVQFQSKNKRMRVVLKPKQNVYGRDGVVGTEPGTTVEFSNYVFQVDDPTAKKLGFQSQTELASALRGAWSFNREFWELGNAPDALKPSVDEMLERIAEAIAYQRVDRLRELKDLETVGDGEQGGHSRHEVLAALDRGLGILTQGKEGKRGAGKPQPLPDAVQQAPVNEEAVARKAMTRSDVS